MRLTLLVLITLYFTFSQRGISAEKIDFTRQIRPVLADRCFHCHGPDEKKRRGDLRLDQKDGLYDDLGDYRILTPGQPEQSELFRRITTTGRHHMPPIKSGKSLSTNEITLIRQWIEQGAEWSQHWSFVPPQRPTLPKVKLRDWPTNPIDYFTLARLEQQNLTPTKPANRRKLIRRLSFDLRGLPPTPTEVNAFLDDSRADAYERLVDRMLSSPRFGERLAIPWLDQARFADTNGFSIDDGRDMWLWRDWVLHAFNTNKPFDQFTIEQLAGDLLPNASIQQKVATGFNRNNMNTHEGGTIPEEYRVIYVSDRVRTTAETWLGLTMGCAQCHDHKYDPITQKDYYRFFAFFNTIPEKGNDGNEGVNSVPYIKATSILKQNHLEAIDQELAQLRKQRSQQNLDDEQRQWESDIKALLANPPKSGLQSHPLQMIEVSSHAGLTFKAMPDQSYLVTSKKEIPSDVYTLKAKSKTNTMTGIKLEVLPDNSLPLRGPGRSDGGVFLLGEVEMFINGNSIPIERATATFSQQDFPISAAIDDDPDTAWGIHPQRGRKHHAIFWLSEPLSLKDSDTITLKLHQNEGWRMEIGRFRLQSVSGQEAKTALPSKGIQKIIQTPIDKRNIGQRATLKEHFIHIAPSLHKINQRIETLEKKRGSLLDQTMIMQEMRKPRDTHILDRGQYNQPREKVTAGTPSALPSTAETKQNTRLELAKWLVSSDNPLTARVTVNRLWQMLFGEGIVRTSGDFGSQGEPPTHPQLLDWLATEFVRTDWDIKRMIKLIVTSSTYLQQSTPTPELLELDPQNRLLARGPRFRLDAELIRDNALAVSGLLVNKLGGRSVKPYQPKGLWVEGSHWPRLFDQQRYVIEKGASLYRRSLYTFIKRTSPHPAMLCFDAPDREICTMQRSRTNTPLQSLVLLNDTQFVEAARVLAEKVMLEGKTTIKDEISYAYERVLNRPPSNAELRILSRSYAQRLKHFREHPEAMRKFLDVGYSKPLPKLNQSELAAWTTITGTLLNLHETITRE